MLFLIVVLLWQTLGPKPGPRLAGNEGIEKNMETIIIGYVGATI